MKLISSSRILPLSSVLLGAIVLLMLATDTKAQQPPYDVFPPAETPYYRVRYEAWTRPGDVIFPVNYTVWIPPGVKQLRGLIVHQHGCGEGSCKSGLTGAYDLHWQALARKHDCALLAPSYEQPEKADCQMWFDPRNGSGAAFRKCVAYSGTRSGFPGLAKVPWGLWGPAAAGPWAAGVMLWHPGRVAVDPLSSHDCGNQRYLAIPWLDACLSARLPAKSGEPLREMPTEGAYLSEPIGSEAVPAAKYAGDPLKAAWLPSASIAGAWTQYVKDTNVEDRSPP